MKQFSLSIILVAMLITTISAAAATTVSHVHWLDDETNEILTITDGDTASFSWKGQTAYYDLQVDLGLYQGSTEIADYPVTCTSSTACNGIGTLTQDNYDGPGIYTLIMNTRDALSDCCGTADDDQITLIVEERITDNDFTGITVTADPSTGDAPLAVQFTCSATGGNTPISYSWTFGDGNMSDEQNPIHTYTGVATYTATCTVADDDGDTISGTVSVVTTQGYIDYDFTSIIVDADPSSGEAPLEVDFTCTALGGNNPISYSWTFGDGTTSSTKNPTHKYTIVNTYVATCTATDDDGDAISGTATVNVQEPQPENQPPEMEPVADQYIIERNEFVYELQVSDPDNTRGELTCYDAEFYKVIGDSAARVKSVTDWMILEDCTLSGTAPEVDNDEKYYIRVGVKDPTGLFDEEEFYLYVIQKNRAPTIAPVDDIIIPEGTQIDLSLAVNDPDNDAIICSVAPGYNLPTWLTLANCAVSGTAPQVTNDQTNNIGIRVTDIHGAYDETDFTIIVTDDSEAPVADFTWTPVSPYANEVASFTDASTDDGTVVNYAWSFGDGATSTTQNPDHAYDLPGDYLITLTVTDNEGLTGVAQKTITVNDDLPTSIAVTANPTSGYVPLTVAFTCTVTGGDAPLTYRWDFDDGEFSSVQNPTHIFDTIGSYTPECLATDADGDQIIGMVTVIVEEPEQLNHAPIMQPIVDHEVDEQTYYFLQLDVSDPDGDTPLVCFSNDDIGYGVALPYWLTLNKNDCTLSGTAPAVDNDEIFYVEVGVQDPAGLADVEYYYLRVNNLVVPNQPPIASFSWTPDEPFTNDIVTFTDQSYDQDGTIVSYYWTFGDGTDSTVQRPTHTYSASGAYTVSLTVTDDDALTDTEQHVITVKRIDHDITDIAVTANPQSGQESLDVDFTCAAIGGDAPVSYYWTFGDGAASNQQNPSHIYAVNGVYTASCTATDIDGDSLTGSITITVAEKDNPIIIDELGCNPDVVRGHEEYCSIHVVDEDGDDVAGVDVTFTYIDPSFVDGINFGSCTTNFKGRCSDDPIVTHEPGYYTVEATASLIGYVPPAPLNDTFLVWEKRYEIIGLEVFEDDSFIIPQDTFYRGEDMYASFAIYDLIEQDFTCDAGLVNEMFLRVHNAQPLQLLEVTDASWLANIQQDLLDWFRGLFGNDVLCTYEYWLPSIPLSDDFLGDGKVFAFTFNFSDSTAGQASKEVTVLNNPVALNVPDFTITKYVASDSGSVTIDLKDYVVDVETLPADMVYAMTTAQAVSIVDAGNGVFTVTAGPGWVDDITIEASADDTDGSIALDSSIITIIIQFVPEPPVAIAGPDQSVVEHTVVSVDGSASYDPDGGDIVAYAWSFDNGDTATGATASTTYTVPGAYTVTLTVTDDEGDQDTDTLDIIVGRQPYTPQCSDGKDNDNDGKVDMDDPNCDSPSDNSEYGPVSTGAERGLNIFSISTYSFWGYERIVSGDFVTVKVVMENEAGEDLEDLRVGFSIPELGVKQKSHQFSIGDDERETIIMDVYIPYDAMPGEYYTEITVANTDLRRSTHRSITVVEE